MYRTVQKPVGWRMRAGVPGPAFQFSDARVFPKRDKVHPPKAAERSSEPRGGADGAAARLQILILSGEAISTIGITLSLMVGFRSNLMMSRWWEARLHLGGVARPPTPR